MVQGLGFRMSGVAIPKSSTSKVCKKTTVGDLCTETIHQTTKHELTSFQDKPSQNYIYIYTHTLSLAKYKKHKTLYIYIYICLGRMKQRNNRSSREFRVKEVFWSGAETSLVGVSLELHRQLRILIRVL